MMFTYSAIRETSLVLNPQSKARLDDCIKKAENELCVYVSTWSESGGKMIRFVQFL